MSAIEALQATLAAEHAALFVYGDAGAHTSQSAEPELFDIVSILHRTHRTRRNQLRDFIIALGATPVAASAGYEVPAQLGSAAAVRRLALRTEERCVAIYADLVANTVSTNRAWAISALSESAQARVLLGGSPEVFPGAPDLADRTLSSE